MWALVLGGFAACWLGCGAAAPVPCRSPGHCQTGTECLANRCLELGADPVAAGSTRRVVEASAVAVVRAHPGSWQGALPPTVALGGPDSGGEALLVRFPRTWADLDVGTAFLLLEPAENAEPTGSDVQVQVALAATSWASGATESGPAERSPTSRGLARTRPPSLLRIDVTAQLKALQASEKDDHGLVVRATEESDRGAVYSTGTAGMAPRLDVYGRPRARSAGRAATD